MSQKPAKPKVFGIGLNKTGTTTLGMCGEILGYKTISCQRGLLEDIIIRKDFSNVLKIVEEYDFFEDWPWPLIYKELDKFFPNSKFILTKRKDEFTWLNSLKKHSLSTDPWLHCRKIAYGYSYPFRREKEHLDFYKNHRDSVIKYFKNRESDFIELCWENGDGWKELCTFLGEEVPPDLFPVLNTASGRKIPWRRYLLNSMFCALKR